MTFNELGLSHEILAAVTAKQYRVPTPIQEMAIPHALAGKDVLGCAQTGTGKTAAFALPIIQRLSAPAASLDGTDSREIGRDEAAGPGVPGSHGTDVAAGHAAGAEPPRGRRRGRGRKSGPRPVRALVLTPTRELATQIGESFRDYGRHTDLRHVVVYGGVSQGPQADALNRGVDILVATPGRLLDLMGQGIASLKAVEVLVLDEADRMLDMGFIQDIRRIVAEVPRERQTLFFSATLPFDIQRLSASILKDPVRVAATPVASTVDAVEQFVYYVEKADKSALLQHLLAGGEIRSALVFTRTKHGADRVARHLQRADVSAEAIHGDKTQKIREKALENLKSGRTRVLVATDVAARGLDIADLSHVVNYDVPNEPEAYVHRIGRTGRAGASGVALSFCDAAERPLLSEIEKLIRKHLAVVGEHPHRSALRPGRPTVLSTDRPKPTSRFLISADVLLRGGNLPAATAGN